MAQNLGARHDEIGLDYVVEILRDLEEVISDERAAEIEANDLPPRLVPAVSLDCLSSGE